MAEIKALAEMLDKDEMGLREMFDMPAILARNIDVQTTRIGFIRSGKFTEFKYNNYAEGDGSFIMLAVEGKYRATRNRVFVDAGPRDVLYLITTAKYQEAQKRAGMFLKSTIMPAKIKRPFAKLVKIINDNIELMVRVLNKRVNEDHNYILNNNIVGTPQYGVINNDYEERATPLRPTADRTLSAISEHGTTN